ncbi:MAG: phage portal protein [Bacteroidetes bacterium]|nr:phage portal protein [Bacteroidota bacterium]
MGIRDTLRLVKNAELLPSYQDVYAQLEPNVYGSTFGVASLNVPFTWITRDEAMTVPAVARARNIVAGTLASLPLELYNSRDEELPKPRWMRQPDPNSTYGTMVAWTIDDLIFNGSAYWQIIEIYKEDGRPSAFRYINFGRVTPQYNHDSTMVEGYLVDGVRVPNNGLGSLITFQALDEGVLKRGASTIKTAIALEQAAKRSAEEPVPNGVLKNTGMDLPEDQVMNLLARFKSARNTRATAYMTSNLEYQPMQFDNTQLQLVESRKAMQTMIAQMMNVPAYLLDAETGGSLTYNNAEGQKRYLVDFSLRNIITVLENRLSMDDITIMGQHVRFDLDDFLRGNPTERAAFYRDVVPLGILTVDEARAMEDLSPAPRSTNGN